MSEKPLVIVTRRLPELVETRLMELFNTKLSIDDKPFSKKQLIDAIKEADILVPTVTDRIDTDVLEASSGKLKLIANFGNGTDHINIETAQKKNIIHILIKENFNMFFKLYSPFYNICLSYFSF